MVNRDYSRVTMMFSLPRSRTQWWAWFFGHGIHSLHDPLSRYSSARTFAKDIDNWLDSHTGRMFVADTAGLFFHETLIAAMPGVQRIYMIRNHHDVAQSLNRWSGRINSFPDLQEANERLYRYAYRNDDEVRLLWGMITVPILRDMWTWVTALPMPDSATLDRWNQHHVDKPIEQHTFDRQKAYRLWESRER